MIEILRMLSSSNPDKGFRALGVLRNLMVPDRFPCFSLKNKQRKFVLLFNYVTVTMCYIFVALIQ